ncbi:MAG TPA: FGGY family carbohydrate kinase [Devosiaceae bacterium]|jgi:glycerol kinase|nr:FGGY family carbohydrate kinase [Devosiaceae bacterium]
MAFVLAIDQGTTNSKALLIDEAGAVVARASAPVGVSYPQPGWVEQSADDLRRSVVDVATRAATAAEGGRIAAIGISNQRESVLVWDRRSGRPIGPCITWQCRRSAERIAALRTPEFEREVAALTGLGLDPLFPAAKLAWLLDAFPEARGLAAAGDLCAGTVDAWLVFNLTGGKVHATDFSNASRTQLFDIRTGSWSPELASTFDVPLNILPEPRASDGDFGVTRDGSGLPAGIPIRAVMGDSHAALFGHGVRAPGPVKATYGTGSSLMTLTEGPVASRHGLSTTIAWRRGERTSYALEGNITVSAQAAAWTAALLGLKDAAALTELAKTVPDSGGAVFVPALAGLGAPHWRDSARAIFAGLSFGTTPAHLARATLEAIALQVRDVFVALEQDAGRPLDSLSVDGGATANEFLMQLQADVLDRPVVRKAVSELSAAGAAVMAGAAAGLWDDAGPAAIAAARDRFTPVMEAETRAALLRNWAAALGKA